MRQQVKSKHKHNTGKPCSRPERLACQYTLYSCVWCSVCVCVCVCVFTYVNKFSLNTSTTRENPVAGQKGYTPIGKLVARALANESTSHPSVTRRSAGVGGGWCEMNSTTMVGTHAYKETE